MHPHYFASFDMIETSFPDELWYSNFRVTCGTFAYILHEIGDEICRQGTNAKSCYARSKPLVECLLSCNVLYTSLVSCEILLFANANWIFSADHRSINMSLASLLQMQILPRSFDAILLLAKSTRFWCLKGSFSTPEPSLSWSVMIAKTLWFWHADLFLSGPRLPSEVVSARLNFSAHGPKNLLLHSKNQAGRALCYWPACQNFGVPCPKLMSCKYAYSFRRVCVY